MKLYNIFAILTLAVIISTLLNGCQKVARPQMPVDNLIPIKQPANQAQATTQPSSSDQLKKFSSAAEILDFLDKNSQKQGAASGIMYKGGMMTESVTRNSVAPMPTGVAQEAAAPSSGGTTDYSQTNVQVEGVDEADLVKNDGQYIYTLVQDKLVIVKAYPADKSEIVSTTELSGRPVSLFLNGDRLVVFSTDNDQTLAIPEYGYIPAPRGTQVTRAQIFDISDRTKPNEVEKFTVNGDYFEARMIGDYVYFVAREGVYRLYNYIEMPMVKSSAGTIVRPDVYYFDHVDDNYQFNTVASFNIKKPQINAKTFMMGYANTLYVSTNNMYIAYQKSNPWYYAPEDESKRFEEAILPMLPAGTKASISTILSDQNLNSYEKWDKISAKLEEMYNNMKESDKEDLISQIDKSTQEYDTKREIERSKTVIHKIAIANGNIEYKAKGEVSGQLLNQFSMDEFLGNLRVATTTNIWVANKGSEVYNNVFILDPEMKEMGKLEDIAPEEQIYSTRFMGERLYMVTFKRMDPLFVIDLSSPGNPKVLGKLKIPGFSDYLHPYDSTHLIGVGKETEVNDYGSLTTKGVKIALFDVTDVENPKEIDHYDIGQAGSDSEVLQDHKAFLFSKEKSLLAIPVREVKSTRYYNSQYGYYSQKVWQGAYVFHVDLQGFQKLGTITHLDGDEEQQYWYNSPSAVRRILYMDDVLYTVSATKIKANDIKTIAELKEIDLPFKLNRYYDYPWWY